MNKKKIIIFLVTIAIIVVGIVLYINNSKDEFIKVTAEKPQKRNIIESVSANGKVQPEIEVKISPDVSGEIIELNVKEGDKVNRGDVVAFVGSSGITSGPHLHYEIYHNDSIINPEQYLPSGHSNP